MGSGATRLAPVDGLRGVAAMMVVFTHIYLAAGERNFGIVGVSLGYLRSGVDLFFVLSGFCLFYPLTKAGSATDWPAFFHRRARWILPAYYAALCLAVALPFVLGPMARMLGVATFQQAALTWQQLWTHLLFLHTLNSRTFFGIDGPFWSLGVEVQFYLAFPLAVWLVHRYGFGGIGVIAMVTVLYRLGVDYSAHQSLHGAFLGGANMTLAVKVNLFAGRWLEFGLGMLAAILVRRGSLRSVDPY